jgi:hypothetical protein
LAAIVWFFGSAAFGFEYSEADLQHVSAASVAASVDGPTTPFMQTALLSKMAAQGAVRGGSLTLAGVQSGFQKILSQGSSSPAAQVASDAYMIYCHTVNITVMEDLAADGPLHLMGIADPDFVAYDVGKPMMPGGLVNRISLGNQAGKADETAKIEKTTLQPAAKTPEERSRHTATPMPPSLDPVAICSTCDDGMDATTYLKYYGCGQVRVTWIVDGGQSQQTMAIGSSTARKNLTRQGFTTIQFGPHRRTDSCARASHHYFQQ